MFDVLSAHLNQSRQQKIIRKYHKLNEKLNALFADVEVVGVEVLDYAVEKRFRHAIDLYQLKIFVYGFVEAGDGGFAVTVAEHRLKIATPALKY